MFITELTREREIQKLKARKVKCNPFTRVFRKLPIWLISLVLHRLFKRLVECLCLFGAFLNIHFD